MLEPSRGCLYMCVCVCVYVYVSATAQTAYLSDFDESSYIYSLGFISFCLLHIFWKFECDDVMAAILYKTVPALSLL